MFNTLPTPNLLPTAQPESGSGLRGERAGYAGCAGARSCRCSWCRRTDSSRSTTPGLRPDHTHHNVSVDPKFRVSDHVATAVRGLPGRTRLASPRAVSPQRAAVDKSG